MFFYSCYLKHWHTYTRWWKKNHTNDEFTCRSIYATKCFDDRYGPSDKHVQH